MTIVQRLRPLLLVAGLTGGVAAACTPAKPPGPQVVVESFACTNGPQAWVVPAGVTVAVFDLSGAQGADYPANELVGGRGGRTAAQLAVTPGETLQINVGCRGSLDTNGVVGDTGGYPDGGVGVSGGGGSSDVRRGAFGVLDRLLVAGGGGGTGSGGSSGGDGGHGGGTTGTAGGNAGPPCMPCAGGGGGGGQASGGFGGSGTTMGDPGEMGGLGVGGDGGMAVGAGPGGGGGGGFYGGGGGGQGTPGQSASAGGGGGSGFGPAGAGFQTGVRSGNGVVVVTYRV